MINADTSAYYSMNVTGTYLLQALLVSGREAGDISQTLEEQFGANVADLEGDVREAISHLESEGLIILLEDGNAATAIEGGEECALPDVYEKPVLECHGNLEQLILSGE